MIKDKTVIYACDNRHIHVDIKGLTNIKCEKCGEPMQFITNVVIQKGADK